MRHSTIRRSLRVIGWTIVLGASLTVAAPAQQSGPPGTGRTSSVDRNAARRAALERQRRGALAGAFARDPLYAWSMPGGVGAYGYDPFDRSAGWPHWSGPHYGSGGPLFCFGFAHDAAWYAVPRAWSPYHDVPLSFQVFCRPIRPGDPWSGFGRRFDGSWFDPPRVDGPWFDGPWWDRTHGFDGWNPRWFRPGWPRHRFYDRFHADVEPYDGPRGRGYGPAVYVTPPPYGVWNAPPYGVGPGAAPHAPAGVADCAFVTARIVNGGVFSGWTTLSAFGARDARELELAIDGLLSRGRPVVLFAEGGYRVEIRPGLHIDSISIEPCAAGGG